MGDSPDDDGNTKVDSYSMTFNEEFERKREFLVSG
jgi:hypothetical protein